MWHPWVLGGSRVGAAHSEKCVLRAEGGGAGEAGAKNSSFLKKQLKTSLKK